MASVSYSLDFSPYMPVPIGPLTAQILGPSVSISYAGFRISAFGDVVDNGGSITGSIYQLSIFGPGGILLLRDINLPYERVLDSVKSRDLTGLIDLATAGHDTVTGDGVRFGGGGDDLFQVNPPRGVVFGGRGTDTYEVLFSSKDAVVTASDTGSSLSVFGGPGPTLAGFEKIKFSDKTVDISPAAPLYDFAASARAILLREQSNDFQLYQDGKAGTKGGIVAALMAQAEDKSIPALLVFDEIMGKAPESAQLDALTAFVSSQIKSPGYQSTSNPRIGGYEAMGLGLSGTAEFLAKFGTGSAADVVRSEYQSLFGRAATEQQVAHFVAQIDYFEALYAGAGVSDGATKARGAVVGQMVGYASAENGSLHASAAAWLTNAVDGKAGYGAPLEMI